MKQTSYERRMALISKAMFLCNIVIFLFPQIIADACLSHVGAV